MCTKIFTRIVYKTLIIIIIFSRVRNIISDVETLDYLLSSIIIIITYKFMHACRLDFNLFSGCFKSYITYLQHNIIKL